MEQYNKAIKHLSNAYANIAALENKAYKDRNYELCDMLDKITDEISDQIDKINHLKLIEEL